MIIFRRSLQTAVAGLAALVLASASLGAQNTQGWKVRPDRSTSASDPDGAGEIRFTARGTGFHAVNPAAAVYWNPTHTAAGAYSAGATFKLLTPSDHVNYYGLIIGGSNLDNDKQTYLYFLVGQNGTWMISRRAGDGRPTAVVPRTANAAVTQPGADGMSTNVLAIRVKNDSVEFVVNNTVVHTASKTELGTSTDGIVGLRVNHRLEVQIDGFAITRP